MLLLGFAVLISAVWCTSTFNSPYEKDEDSLESLSDNCLRDVAVQHEAALQEASWALRGECIPKPSFTDLSWPSKDYSQFSKILQADHFRIVWH